LAALQAYGIAVGLESQGTNVVIDPGWYLPHFATVITLTGGTVFLMWLGEQITARGIGNGISLIIFAGIIAELPCRAPLPPSLELGRTGADVDLPDHCGHHCPGPRRYHRLSSCSWSAPSGGLLVKYPKRQVGSIGCAKCATRRICH
jgi:hypothetical protein